MEEALHKRTVADIPILEFGQVASTHHIARDVIENRRGDMPLDANEVLPGSLYGAIVADNQIAGRGRRERRWESLRGSSLLATFIIGKRELYPMTDVAHLMVAVCDVLKKVGPSKADKKGRLELKIKWPNDLVVDAGTGETKKVGGCLTEVVNNYLMVGVGINVTQDAYPADITNATSLQECGYTITANELLDQIVKNYAHRRIDSFSDSDIWKEYKSFSSTLGQKVRIETITETFEGFARDISSDGSLIVEKNTGEVLEISEGDVVHLRGVEDQENPFA